MIGLELACVAILLVYGLVSWYTVEHRGQFAGEYATIWAAAWFADTLVGGVEGLRGSPILLLLALSGAAAVVRVLMPSIVGYLAFVIPVAMATGASLGLNPLVCGLAVVIVGDSAVYYPAGSASSIFVFQRSGIRAPEVFRFGLIMTGVSIAVLFAIVLPYWRLIGEGLTR